MRHSTISRVLVAAAAVTFLADVHAAAITEVPDLHASTFIVAGNQPSAFNVFYGLGQSFVAQDSSVEAGLYLEDGSGAGGQLQYSLYAGDGTFASLLAVRTIDLGPGPINTATLRLADFSQISLTAGEHYTLFASLPGGALPATGTYSNLKIALMTTPGGVDAYPDGSIYEVKSNGIVDLGRDAGFEVVPVPEPSSFALMLAGLGAAAVGVVRRRRQSHLG